MSTQSVRQAVVAASLALLSQVSSAELAVIVNPRSLQGLMTAEQVSAIFLGKTVHLPTGATAALSDLPEANSTRDAFYSKVTGKTPEQAKATWTRLAFSGKAALPRELGSAVEVKRFVAGNPDGIGYIDKSAVDSSVKVVLSVD
jgi:ABC-type phosphate transport system substrate-binding protein